MATTTTAIHGKSSAIKGTSASSTMRVDSRRFDERGNGALMAESSWEIRTSLGRRSALGVDGCGWLWEIGRDQQTAQVMIEITVGAWSTDPQRLPDDTRQALETDGRAELLKVLRLDCPPRVIRCGSTGCRYRSAPEWSPGPDGRAPIS
jgi:hypothetical protein